MLYDRPLPQLLQDRLTASYNDAIWTKMSVPLSEEDIGIDVKGKFASKGKPVLVEVHGTGIFVSDEKFSNSSKLGLTAGYGLKLINNEFENLLDGKIQDNPEIPIYHFDEFRNTNKFPTLYAIVLDFDIARETESGRLDLEKLYNNPVFQMRVGSIETATLFLDKLRNWYSDQKFGNRHSFNDVDPNQPQGRLLTLGSEDFGIGDGGLYYRGKVGTLQEPKPLEGRI